MRPLITLLIISLVGSASARASGQKPPAPAPAEPAAKVETAPTPPPDYVYSTDGRRDPFVSLLSRGTDGKGAVTNKTRPEGVGGILVDEVIVHGIVQVRGGWVAMIGSPSGRTYSIRPGDRLLDGNVRTINAQAVVLMQDVNDPLSLEKQREVRKFLRGEGK
jgi:type IV pilus assembly protein PilP